MNNTRNIRSKKPSVVVILPTSPSKSSTIAQIIAHCRDEKPEWVKPSFETIRVCDPADVTPTFDKPRFSRAYLHAVNLILIVRDAKVHELEQSLLTTTKEYEAEQEALTNTLTPSRRPGCVVVQSYYAGWYPVLKSYSLVTLPDVCRFVAGIKDRNVAALYKSDLHTIKRLTRGRR